MSKNIFARPGQSAANAQNRQIRATADQLGSLVNQASPWVEKGINGLGAHYDRSAPAIRALNNRAAGMLEQSASRPSLMLSPEAAAMRTGQAAQSAAMGDMRSMIASNPQMAEAMRAGLMLRAMNQGAGAMGSTMGQLYSAEGMAARAQAESARRAQAAQYLTQAADLRAQAPEMALIQALAPLMFSGAGTMFTQPKVQVGAGFGDVLGGMAGSLMGAGGLGALGLGGGGRAGLNPAAKSWFDKGAVIGL